MVKSPGGSGILWLNWGCSSDWSPAEGIPESCGGMKPMRKGGSPDRKPLLS